MKPHQARPVRSLARNLTRNLTRSLAVTLAVGAGAALLTASGCAVWRVGQAAALAKASEPLQQTPADATVRMLIVGDSTAVGTGATSAQHSLAGLMAREYPRLLIENRAQDGAKLADVVAQLGGEQRFDIVLVQAGGNDVIRMGALEGIQADVERVASLASARGKLVLLMPAGNVGNAPFFFAPVSWWMTRRSRALHAFVQAAAARHGAAYVNLFHERADDPFVQNPGLHAHDGLHPSDAGYASWWQVLQEQASAQAQAQAQGSSLATVLAHARGA